MPPLKKQNINVVKVPLRSAPIDRPQVFPRMPRLYLELIENKSKIKQDLIDKEYIAPDYPSSPRGIEQHSIDNEKGNSNSNSNFNSRLDMLLSDDESDYGDRSRDRSRGGDNYSVNSDKISNVSSSSELSIEENKYKSDDDKDDDDNKSKDTEDLSLRLKELLNDDDSEVTLTPKKRSSRIDKYSIPRDNHGHTTSRVNIESQAGKQFTTTAPTLAELEKQGGYVGKKELRDISQVNRSEKEEDDAKRELLFKFDLLRKSYPGSNIPDYTVHTELTTLEKSYTDTVRRLSLDSSVESYKTYLVYGFMGCEFIFGNFLGFDMQGFTQQQIISMNSYEKLLIELGEKSYVPKGSKWPVELRLLFMIMMNAAFFVVSKMMMKKTGANLMGMINNMNSKSSVSQQPPAQKKRMQGPNIDIGDIPSPAG